MCVCVRVLEGGAVPEQEIIRFKPQKRRIMGERGKMVVLWWLNSRRGWFEMRITERT